MNRRISQLCCCLLVVHVACSDDTDIITGTTPTPTPTPTFANVAGSFSGAVVGVSQGSALNGALRLAITQSQSALTGTWALNGTLTPTAGAATPVAQSGTLTGTVTPGANPTAVLTLTSTACPNVTTQLTGTFDAANRLNIAGPVPVLDNACTVMDTLPTNTFLNPAGANLPLGGVCVTPVEDGGDGDAEGPPTFSPGLFAVNITLSAALDGIADDGSLPVSIDQVCNVPQDLAANAAQLVGGDGVVLMNAATRIRSCGDAVSETCESSLLEDGALLTGADATTALGGADSAVLSVRLLPVAQWSADEDGNPIPTFGAAWVKIID